MQLISAGAAASLTEAIHLLTNARHLVEQIGHHLHLDLGGGEPRVGQARAVLEPPRNQDMVPLRLYVARPRWWIDWRRVDEVSQRVCAEQLPERRTARGGASLSGCLWPHASSAVDEDVFRTIVPDYARQPSSGKRASMRPLPC